MALLAALSLRAAGWLTPMWLLGVGVLVGLAAVLLLWLAVYLLGRLPGLTILRRIGDEFGATIQEGVLFYVLILAGVVAAWGLIGTFVVRPPAESWRILTSLRRAPYVGARTMTFDIAPPQVEAAGSERLQPVDVNFYGSELREISFSADQSLTIVRDPVADLETGRGLEVRPGDPAAWQRRGPGQAGAEASLPFGRDEVGQLHVRNNGTTAGRLEIRIVTGVEYPQVMLVPITALGVLGLFLLYALQVALMPRLSAVALATFKSEIAQPHFLILMILGGLALVLYIYIPYYTFGEDIKVLEDSGLVLIKVLSIVLVVWAASSAIADEIEGRTALTVLSKPIRRQSFVLGKFCGIAWTSALMYLVLGVVLLAVVCFKTIYDAREASQEIPQWELCYLEMVGIVPGLVLGFMETLLFAALGVAISTRLPLLPNFLICFTVYVLGHLTPLIVQVTEKNFEIVKFVGQLIATVFPNLEVFDTQAAIAAGFTVPAEYLGWSLLYCLIFGAIAMLLALVLFEDRDLA